MEMKNEWAFDGLNFHPYNYLHKNLQSEKLYILSNKEFPFHDIAEKLCLNFTEQQLIHKLPLPLQVQTYKRKFFPIVRILGEHHLKLYSHAFWLKLLEVFLIIQVTNQMLSN